MTGSDRVRLVDQIKTALSGYSHAYPRLVTGPESAVASRTQLKR